MLSIFFSVLQKPERQTFSQSYVPSLWKKIFIRFNARTNTNHGYFSYLIWLSFHLKQLIRQCQLCIWTLCCFRNKYGELTLYLNFERNIYLVSSWMNLKQNRILQLLFPSNELKYIHAHDASTFNARCNDSPTITNATASNSWTMKSDDSALQPKMFSSSFVMLARVKMACPPDESPLKVPLTRLTYAPGAGGLNETLPVWSTDTRMITSFSLFFLIPQFAVPVSPENIHVNVTVDPETPYTVPPPYDDVNENAPCT